MKGRQNGRASAFPPIVLDGNLLDAAARLDGLDVGALDPEHVLRGQSKQNIDFQTLFARRPQRPPPQCKIVPDSRLEVAIFLMRKARHGGGPYQETPSTKTCRLDILKRI